VECHDKSGETERGSVHEINVREREKQKECREISSPYNTHTTTVDEMRRQTAVGKTTSAEQMGAGDGERESV